MARKVVRLSDPVIISEHLDDAARQWLDKRVHLHEIRHDDLPAFHEALAEAAGLVVRTYTQVNASLLKCAPKLKVVGRAGVGLDNIDLKACKKRDVQVVYTPDANTQAVVEYVWGLIFEAVRPRIVLEDYVPPPKFHEHRANHVGRQVDQLVLGILGMGRIGRRVAEVARAFGMRVLYHDLLSRRQLGLSPEDMSEFVDAGTLFAESDILTIHVDGRKENRGLIDGEALQRMKRHVLLLNTSRGMVVDVEALAQWAKRAAKRGDPSLAILDVHDPEPPTDDYPLYGLSHVKLLPHLASRTYTAMANMSWVVRDVDRVLRSEPPQYPAT